MLEVPINPMNEHLKLLVGKPVIVEGKGGIWSENLRVSTTGMYYLQEGHTQLVVFRATDVKQVKVGQGNRITL